MDPPVGVAGTQRRVWLATLGAGAWGALLSGVFARREGFHGDFLAWWYGGRVLLAGGNPYASPPAVAPFFVNDPLLYPFTAVVAALPVAPLPYLAAVVLFFGVGAGLLGYAVARYRPHAWPLFVGMPFLMAASLGHWGPYLAAAALLPAAGFLIAVKPNVGLACLVSRPSRAMALGAAALVAVSLAVWPRWPVAWWVNVRAAPPHTIPVWSWFGAPLVLAALRWRRPEGRLLLAMALVSQTAMFADQLVLSLVARSRRDALVLALASLVGGVAWALGWSRGGSHPALAGAPYVVASVYLPALVMVLRLPRDAEPGDGDRVPRWLAAWRGRAARAPNAR